MLMKLGYAPAVWVGKILNKNRDEGLVQCCFRKVHIKVTLTSFTFSLFSLPSYKLNL